jgi:formiminotetrahydrofolate cyclodeaminase
MGAQQNPDQLIGLTLTEFADALGSEQTAPGGGSASALAGALGGALAEMVARLTFGRAKYAAYQEEMAAVEELLKTRLLALVDADTTAYNRIVDAYKLPKETDAQKVQRTAAVQSALRVATEVPLTIAEACAEVLDLTIQVAEHGNRTAASDAAVGALLAHAGLLGAAHNVRINLSSLKDDAFCTHARSRVAALLEAGESALARALAAADA